MKRVLIIGGTWFVGKRLTRNLIDSGARVTLLTRGRTVDPFGDAVERLTADRCDREAVARVTAGREWDIVFDQMCLAPDEAAAACDIFGGRIGRYVMASSQSVYFSNMGPDQKEGAFDPWQASIRMGGKADMSYEDGKCFAEAVFFQRAPFPVAAIRWPFLVGTDDLSGRLHWHVQHIRDGAPMGIANPDAIASFIPSQEAADFASWLGNSDFTGPINICSTGLMPFREMLAVAEESLGKQAIIVPEDQVAPEHVSPICSPVDWYMNVELAQSLGWRPSDIHSWMPDLWRALAAPNYVVPKREYRW